MRLVAFGAGYVGLVTGTGLSEVGHSVLCVDIDPDKIRQLNDGVVPIYEPGLGDLVKRNRRSGRLQFAVEVSAPFDGADVYFIGVGTPAGPDGSADLRAVFAAADTIAATATRSAIVAMKSTVPVGTCDAVQERLDRAPVPGAATRAKVKLEVVSNPEFLKEGSAVVDFFKPERIVVGARSEHARTVLRELYAPLQLSGERLVMTDPRSSELIKYASNTMLAMRVSFMNEMSRLCHATGADIHAVRLGMGSDSRVGKKFLYAGPGYGGSCFPKDVQALTMLGKKHGVPMRLAEATDLANHEQADFLAGLVEEAVGGCDGKTIAFWGLAFKPETDDVRESPALKLAQALLGKGASIVGHDPEAGPNFAKLLQDHPAHARLRVVDRDYDAVDQADAVVLLTEWRSYRAPDFAEIARRMRGKVALDARNVWRPADVVQAGLRYRGVGVPSVG